MKVTIIHKKSGVDKSEFNTYNKFIKYLQKEFPLKHDLTITFLGERVGDKRKRTKADRRHLKKETEEPSRAIISPL